MSRSHSTPVTIVELAARLTGWYILNEESLHLGESKRIGWIKVLGKVVEHARRCDWKELMDHEEDIEKLVQEYTAILKGESKEEEKRTQPRKLQKSNNRRKDERDVPPSELKTYQIVRLNSFAFAGISTNCFLRQPTWYEPRQLRHLSPLLCRSYAFYEYVIEDLIMHYGEDPVNLEGKEKPPSWLTQSEDLASFRSRMIRERWESAGVTYDQRFQVLLALRGPTAVSSSPFPPPRKAYLLFLALYSRTRITSRARFTPSAKQNVCIARIILSRHSLIELR